MPHLVNGVERRTREEALHYLIEQAEAGKIGPNIASGDKPICRYHYSSGNHCAVGALLTPEQIELIDNMGYGDQNASAISSLLGKANLTDSTGLSLYELIFLQGEHDNAMNQTASEEGDQLDEKTRAKNAVDAVIQAARHLLSEQEPAPAKV